MAILELRDPPEKPPAGDGRDRYRAVLKELREQHPGQWGVIAKGKRNTMNQHASNLRRGHFYKGAGIFEFKTAPAEGGGAELFARFVSEEQKE